MYKNSELIKRKKMAKDTGIYGTGAGMIQTGSFGARLFGYAIFFIPMSLLLFVILIAGGGEGFSAFLPNNIFGITIALLIVFSPLILLFIFWEKSIRKFRRKNGLSVYGNIKEELEQMKFNEEYAKEAKAREAFEASKSSDRMNINYWFELLQKGAITQDEYETKKRELL